MPCPDASTLDASAHETCSDKCSATWGGASLSERMSDSMVGCQLHGGDLVLG